MTITPSAPPGWYDDGTGRQRWWDGMRWTDHYAQVVPVAPTYPAAYAGVVSPKSRTVASILGFFLGGLGVDRFYLGNVGMGVAKLFLGWLTLGIWPFVDWLIILTGNAHDGQGLPVTRWE
jgi:hypothetical protein